MRPQLVLLAGPNGAGKTTFYEVFLSSSPLPFLNADVMEARTGITSAQAARILDALRDQMIDQQRGFITETVFSDRVGAKLSMLRKAVENGYEVVLIYVGVESAALAELRVEQRVSTGGHDVPRDRISSRFERSVSNLRLAIGVASTVKIYDNSYVDEPYQLLAMFEAGKRTFMATRVPTGARSIVGLRVKSKR